MHDISLNPFNRQSRGRLCLYPSISESKNVIRTMVLLDRIYSNLYLHQNIHLSDGTLEVYIII
jgi:hypothetical protein